ncbi:MAG TPA: alpha/beta hydrolase, partial [Chryseosolibacter sp.]
QHWSFLATLVESLQCTIIAPDYPLAPRHTYRDSFDMVVPLYQELVNAVPPRDLIVMGDSAGGGFALALIQYLSTQTIPLPSQLFLFSPWLDITLKNPAILEIDSRDPFLGIDGLKRAGKAYAGSAPPELYLLSPINGPMNMLPEVYLFVGSNDIMVADARKLKRILTEKNVPIQYREYEDMIHVWMFLNFPESKKARSEIIEFIRDR